MSEERSKLCCMCSAVMKLMFIKIRYLCQKRVVARVDQVHNDGWQGKTSTPLNLIWWGQSWELLQLISSHTYLKSIRWLRFVPSLLMILVHAYQKTILMITFLILGTHSLYSLIVEHSSNTELWVPTLVQVDTHLLHAHMHYDRSTRWQHLFG